MTARMRLPRHGFIFHYVALSIWLVVVTAVAVGTVIIQTSSRQVERDADRRLADGVRLLHASLDEAQDDRAAVANWLQQDPTFIAAVQENRLPALGEWLALALNLRASDELGVADQQGQVMVQSGSNHVLRRGPSIAQYAGFQKAIMGSPSAGFVYDSDAPLRHEFHVPIRRSTGETVIGVLRLSTFLDQDDLDRFHHRTGLDASLFLGETMMATTLRTADGLPLAQVVAPPDVLRAVVDEGHEVSAWHHLSIGRVRARFIPLNGPSGTPVGMFSTSLPAESITGRLGEVLAPSLPLTMVIILAGAAFAYLLAHRIQQPIMALAQAAARIHDGDFLTPIPAIRGPEFAVLAGELEAARSSVHATFRTIADAEERQRALFAALLEPVLTTSAEGRITGFNGAAADWLGGPLRLYGQDLHEILPFVDTSAEANSESRWQGRIGAADDVTRDVEVSRTRLAGGTFPPTDMYVIHDVSRYAELSRMREQLLYSVAHEVRGPITILDNVLDILANEYKELSAVERSQLARSARSTVARLQNIVETLLTAGSIQSGRFEVHPAPIRLSVILDDACQMAAPLTEARGQRLERQFVGDDRRVLADRSYVRQLLGNLISNASKYSPDGDLIRLRAETMESYCRVTVEDRGQGIPIEQQAGLFERFYRTQSTVHAEGIGLGLAIAKAVADAHGGAIGVESAPGVGTRVWFTLPMMVECAD